MTPFFRALLVPLQHPLEVSDALKDTTASNAGRAGVARAFFFLGGGARLPALRDPKTLDPTRSVTWRRAADSRGVCYPLENATVYMTGARYKLCRHKINL